MPDVEPVKGKVIIEYDGSGIDAARKDLASLADIVGGGLTESVGGANEALSSLDEQMGKSTDSAGNLVSSVGALEKPLQLSSNAVATVSEALGAQQVALLGAGTAFEGIQRPIESTTAMLENASPPMLAIAQNAESMQKQMSGVNDGFTQIGESLAQSVPLLPQFAESLHSVSAEFDPRAFGLDTFNENLGVFQDALANPYPFSMIHQYLSETGQTWDDFSSSIGDDNAAMLEQMAAMPVESGKAFGAMSSDIASVGQSFSETAGQTEEFNKSWNDMAGSIGEVGQAGGMGTMLLGPEESWSKLDNALTSTEEGIGKIGAAGGEVASGGFSFGGMFGGAMNALNQIAMPLFAVQMIGMAVSAVGQGIYNMAALAEGPAAHSVGSFTGAIDQLSQHSQSMGEQLSESFGQGVKPMIDAINSVQSQSSGSGGGFWSDLAAGVGGTLGALGDIAQIGVGGVVGGLTKLITLNGAWGGSLSQSGDSMVQSGWQGLQNLWATITGQPEPYPTPGSGGASSIQINLPAIQSSIAQSISVMQAQATNPQYLAANAYLQSQAAYAQQGQTAYDISHATGRSPFDYTPQAYQNAMGAYALANGGTGFGLSDVDLNRLYFTNMLNNLPSTSGGCFPAGTPVVRADGRSQAIELLRAGDRVLAHDGTKQVTATVCALLKPPPKQVYELAFSDGSTLTLTDSHPISTTQGWKSISPDATKKENPDLAVTALQAGDGIHTTMGTCTLLAIEPRGIVQVYNITVDDPHTFYAGGVLVHNKALGLQMMQNVADSSVPQMDMKNSNLIQSMMSNFSDADLSHTFTATVSWAATGLENTFTGAASWVGQNLTNAFTGAASWIGQNLSNAFTGIASWAGQNLSKDFQGVASWIGQNLSNVFTGAASWIGQGLSNTFTGIADWVGQNLEHTFTGVADWTMQQVTQVVGSIPGFSSGIEGFVGGLALVGESGPELVYLPHGTSVYPQSNSGNFQPLNMGHESGPLIVTINHTTMLDGKVVAQETIPYIAPILRSVRGVRQ